MSFLVNDETLELPQQSKQSLREEWEGHVPPETNEAYHKRPELSSSDLKYMIDGPEFFKRFVLEKDQLLAKKSKKFDLGTTAHEAYLLRDYAQFVVDPKFKPYGTGKNKVTAKSQMEAFASQNLDKRILSQADFRNLMRMMEVISRHEMAQKFIRDPNVFIEQGFLYKDHQTGIPCKFRPDILNLNKKYIVDYKTTNSIQPNAIVNKFVDLHYHLSVAHYLAGVERLYGEKIRDVFFLFQQTSEPYSVRLYQLKPEDLDRSFILRDELLARISECKQSNIWPDRSDEVLTLDLPNYAFHKEII